MGGTKNLLWIACNNSGKCALRTYFSVRCSIPLSLCHGQAYDGAAVMKGIRSGVAKDRK